MFLMTGHSRFTKPTCGLRQGWVYRSTFQCVQGEIHV
jgi:hypothetical protein